MTDHTPISQVSRLEVISTGARRRWTLAEKQRIVAESYSAPRVDPACERRAGMAGDRSHRYEEGLCEFVVAGAGGAAARSAERTSVLLSWAPRRSVEGDLA